MGFARARGRMVDAQLASRGVGDPRVLDAMRYVPREAFVPESMAEFAYEDAPIPNGAGHVVLQPYCIASRIEAAEVGADDKVLEVGSGAGYGAAVLGQIADRVYAVERRADVVEDARERFARLGYDNIDVRAENGTQGWPEAQPFDAIIVASEGPGDSRALRDQLAVGGRLVMPAEDGNGSQRLVRFTRRSANRFDREDLGEADFVPPVAAAGAEGAGRPGAARGRRRPSGGDVAALIRQAAEPLPELHHAAFAGFVDRFADADVVLLGEASHGTSEFYRARSAITRRLIERHGFTIVAAEADWPDAAAFDRYVRLRPTARRAEQPFERFPTWMWRNADVDEFIRWLRTRNAEQPARRRAGFYGLDLYNLSSSIRAVIDYLDAVDPDAARVARERYGCLKPWQSEPQTYGRMALRSGYALCEEPVVSMLQELLEKQLGYVEQDGESFLDAAQNARLVRDAEAYYRAMYYGAADSWNLRDRHMFDTLVHLLEARGGGAKAVVWAHNSHIGNAAHTEMGLVRGQLNIGQLCRERFGDKAVLVGFGTHAGTVAAASDWDGPLEIKRINPSLPESYERLAHDAGIARFLLDLRHPASASARSSLMEPRLERFIGVIYRPETERWSHYAQCFLPRQFDAYVWFDRTSAVTPLAARQVKGEDDTYPFGL